MPDSRDLDYQPIEKVCGSPIRSIRTLGGAMAIFLPIPITGLWVFAKSTTATKVVVTVCILAFAFIALIVTTLISATVSAQVRDRTLNFYFCGWRTRSIQLGDSTRFEVYSIGRCEILCIKSRGSDYVRNGALANEDVAELLRANGVLEQTTRSSKS